MEAANNNRLFVGHDDYNEEFYGGGNGHEPANPDQNQVGQNQAGQNQAGQNQAGQNQAVIDISNDDEGQENHPLVPTGAGSVQPNQQPQQEVINLEDVPEQYYLAKFGKFHPKNEVYRRLRNTYSKIFRRQATLAMPGGNLRQHLEDISNSARSADISYLIDRDQRFWGGKLRTQKADLVRELNVLTELQEKIKRPDYDDAFDRVILTPAQEKANQIEEDGKLREKLITELKIFAKLE